MANIPGGLLEVFSRINLRGSGLTPPQPGPKEASRATFTGDAWPCEDCDCFSPSPSDIEVVRAMLVKAMRLPPLIIDDIFDFAEYWARSTASLRTLPEVYGSSASENSFLLRSYPVGLVNLGGKETDVPLMAASYIAGRVEPVPLNRTPDAHTFAKLAKYPTPRLVKPVRKVVFSVRSKDQGWASDSTSWTWFEAGLERFDAEQPSSGSRGTTSDQADGDANFTLSLSALKPLQPKIERKPSSTEYTYLFPLAPEPDWLVVKNHLKEKQWRNHVITWSHLDDIDPESDQAKELEEGGRGRATGTGEFVRNLRLGDVVTLWAKARFPGWVNHIMEARIDIYWAV